MRAMNTPRQNKLEKQFSEALAKGDNKRSDKLSKKLHKIEREQDAFNTMSQEEKSELRRKFHERYIRCSKISIFVTMIIFIVTTIFIFSNDLLANISIDVSIANIIVNLYITIWMRRQSHKIGK